MYKHVNSKKLPTSEPSSPKRELKRQMMLTNIFTAKLSLIELRENFTGWLTYPNNRRVTVRLAVYSSTQIPTGFACILLQAYDFNLQ